MYRDAVNYKNSGDAVFIGAITPEQLKRLETAFDEGLYFIASQINVSSVFLWSKDANYDPDTIGTEAMKALKPGEFVIGEDDHCWHEFTGADATDATATDPRTIEQFVAEVEAAAASGWAVFEPGEVSA